MTEERHHPRCQCWDCLGKKGIGPRSLPGLSSKLPSKSDRKRCPDCKRLLGPGKFAKNKRGKDGLNWICRECHSMRMKQYKAAKTATKI